MRELVFVLKIERERERERESMCVCDGAPERESFCVGLCGGKLFQYMSFKLQNEAIKSYTILLIKDDEEQQSGE